MYTIILDEGLCIRDSDQKQIAPCENPLDNDFMDYLAWIQMDNEPLTIISRGYQAP